MNAEDMPVRNSYTDGYVDGQIDALYSVNDELVKLQEDLNLSKDTQRVLSLVVSIINVTIEKLKIGEGL